MDSLEISASCSGPRAPGARQAVLIPDSRGVIKAKIIRFRVTLNILHHPTTTLGESVHLLLSSTVCPVQHNMHANPINKWIHWLGIGNHPIWMCIWQQGEDKARERISSECVCGKVFMRVILIQKACITQQ